MQILRLIFCATDDVTMSYSDVALDFETLDEVFREHCVVVKV